MNLNRLTIFSSVVILSFLLTGCNQYEVSKDSQGRTIRLNKSTGEVTVIEGGKLIVPKTEEQAKAEADAKEAEAKAETAKLSDRRQWPITAGILGTKAMCSTIYMNNALRYEVVFGKKPQGYTGDYGQYFDVLFLKNGIKVFEDRANVTNLVDDNGQRYTIRLTGTITMSEEDYKNLDSVTYAWIL